MVWGCVGTNCTRNHAPDVSTLYHLRTSQPSGAALCVMPGTYMMLGKGTTMEITRELRTLAKFTSETMPVLRGERSEEHTSELQSLTNLVCRLLLEKKKKK